MKNYQDFPILTEEQYSQLKTEYSNTNSKNIKTCFEYLNSALTYFRFNENKFNFILQNEIKNSTNTLIDCIESLKILYPKLNFEPTSHNTNLFSNLNLISQCIMFLTEETVQNKKVYYKKILSKITIKLIDSLSNMLSALSCQELRFYRFQ